MIPSRGPDAAPLETHRAEPPGAVLFDLDGTLVDTIPDIARAVNGMLEDMGRPTHPPQRIRQWVGEGAARLVQRALAGTTEGRPPATQSERGLALFYERYAARIHDQSRPYPGAKPLLAALRRQGIQTGCVTNKPERHTRLLLDALSLTRDFDVIVGGDTLERRKPDPAPIRFACRTLNVGEADSVYVGDSLTDCRAAAAAGVAMVLVSYGYHHGADLTRAPCESIIDSLDELPEILAMTPIQPW